MNIPVPITIQKLTEEELGLICQDRLIHSIKSIRERTGLGLVEAKDMAVEARNDIVSFLSRILQERDRCTVTSVSTEPNEPNEPEFCWFECYIQYEDDKVAVKGKTDSSQLYIQYNGATVLADTWLKGSRHPLSKTEEIMKDVILAVKANNNNPEYKRRREDRLEMGITFIDLCFNKLPECLAANLGKFPADVIAEMLYNTKDPFFEMFEKDDLTDIMYVLERVQTCQ